MDGVYAEGGLGRFDTLPGDIQLIIWDMVQADYNKAASTIRRLWKQIIRRRYLNRAMRPYYARVRARRIAKRNEAASTIQRIFRGNNLM